MAYTMGDLTTRLDKLEGLLEKAASRPTAPKGVVFQGNSPFTPHSGRDWPVEQLNALAKSYGSEQGIHHYGTSNGRKRVSGFGPALVSMAALSGNRDAMAIAKSQGLFSDGYGPDQLEKQHGFYTVQKAATHGIPTFTGEIRKTALYEGSGMTGGYLIPPQFQNELLTIAGEEGFVEPRCKVIPMNSRTVQWPMLDITTAYAAGTTPYAGGIVASWQPEASTFNETEPQFRQSEWVAWDLVMYTLASNQLLADNGIGLDALLTQLFGWAMTWYKEYAYLRGLGAGSSMPLGVLNAPATLLQNRAVANAFKLADAAAMMSHLQVRSWDDACWVMHQSVLPQLIQMVDNANSNRLVWVSPMGDAKSVGPAAMKLPQAFLNGLPIYFTEKVPSLGSRGDVMLIDWSRYVIGTRLDLQVDVSPHVRFQQNQMAWRVIARLDGRPWLNGPITDAEGFTVSPFIALN